MTFAGTGVTNAINNAGDIKALDAQNEAQLWKAGADMYEQTEDILGKMEGGLESIIQTETSTSTGRGHEVHFRVMSGFYGSGLQGEELFAGNRDLLEQINMTSQSVRVDLLRNGIENFFLTEDGLGMRGEIMNNVNENMGMWMGREKTHQGIGSMIHQVSTDNHFIANGGGTLDDLKSGDVLTMDDIISANAMLEPMGGTPAYVGTNGGEKVTAACFLTTTEGARGLKSDPEYKQVQRDAGVRGSENLIFKGGVSMIDGNMIKTWNVIDHDGVGAVGSFLNPKGYLGVPIVAGTTNNLTGTGRAICGGGNATNAARSKVAFWRFFPKFAFKFVGGGTLSTTASTNHLTSGGKFYVTIVNPKNAPNTPGGEVIRNKWTIMEIDSNGFTANGNELVPTKILGPGADSGIRSAAVGGVTYDAAKNTMNFVEGALVYWSNSKGVPIGRTLALYRGAMRRAYGQFRNRRLTDTREGGVVNELYIASIFGQKPRQNAAGKFPAIMAVNHAISYQGWNHPIVT